MKVTRRACHGTPWDDCSGKLSLLAFALDGSLHAFCTACNIVASHSIDIQTVCRQGGMFVCVGGYCRANVGWHGSPKRVVVELGKFQQRQVVHGLRNFPVQIIAVQPQTAKSSQLAQRGGDGSGESGICQRQRCQSRQQTDIIRDGSGEASSSF